MSIINGNYPKDNLGFGEVKSPMEVGNYFVTNKDLCRLGAFCKAAIGTGKLSACLALHVIGFDVTFYLVEQHADGLYTMTKVCHFIVSLSIEHVPASLKNCNKLKNLLNVFETRCIPLSDPYDIESLQIRKRISGSFVDVDMDLEKTIKRKR
ncbi:hypothetical protein RMATCC62417_15788 [Rhizopus microsporus]|nr:hypothetical protein RMATCC62417_15788 [Rhizopus microsporus]